MSLASHPEHGSADPGSTANSSSTVQMIARGVGWAGAGLFVVASPAWALPSPDVVVSLFASLAQVLGLLTVILGKWFFGGRRKNVSSARSAAGYRTAFLVSTGLLVCALIGWGLSAAHQADLRMRRLEVNTTRESKENGKKIVDLSLKETGFADQQEHEDGVQSDWLEAALSRHESLQMFDIRESEEVEMGVIPGARAVRFPDLMREPEQYLDPSQTTYLFCANGNRSCEMATFLEEKGYPARFLVGGYEKWVAEERTLETPGGAPRTELRALPDFANKNLLLDTSDVMALMEERDVLFVDVRYPGDFEAYGHLPGAVNLPIRKLTTPELEAALRALPKKPVIVPCYDRRSSFFGQILGLRITRMGGEFLGRYTVPEEFHVPKKDKDHVAAWKSRHEGQTLLSIASAPLAGALTAIQDEVPSLALSILILVGLIRLCMLPLTLKSNRDRITQAKLEPRMKALKAELRDDPEALSRASSKLLRENRIRPFLNLSTTFAQLVLFSAFFSVVNEACRGSAEPFLWLPALGDVDPTNILPVAISALLIVQLLITGKKPTWIRGTILAAAAVGLFLLVFQLRAGTNLYLAANLVLLAVESAFVARHLRERRPVRTERTQVLLESQDVVPLRSAQRLPDSGGKATRLAALLEAGLPVPEGFVVRGRAIEAWRSTGMWSAPLRARILHHHARLGANRVAVRSSGSNEDGADKSYAGVFETVLDVRPEALFEAIESVAGSLSSGRAQAYSNGSSESGSIVIQEMVPAEYAGVLFTEHPGESGAAAIELVAGLGDELVSGRVAPLSFRFGRMSARPLDERQPPIDLAPLFELGRRIEALFGRPQDIEWAFARGRFSILQARDITRRCTDSADGRGIRERERSRLLELARGVPAGAIFLEQNELSELLPEPTPFSLGWMDEMWAYGGSTHLACRSLGIPYEVLPDSPPFAIGVFGALYVNRPEEKRRLSKSPGALASFRLSRNAAEIERSWREDYLPGFLREMRMLEALDLARLDLDELVDLFRRTSIRFHTEDYVHAEVVNVAADFYLKVAVRQLEKRGLDPAQHLSHLPPTIVHEAMERIARVGRGESELSEFLALFGSRAPHDFELAEPRYSESPSIAMSMVSRSAGISAPEPRAAPTIGKRVLRLAVERARRFQALKEEAKHHAMRELAFVRSLLLEIGRRLGVGEGIFHLTPAEVRGLAAAGLKGRSPVQRILERQEELEALREVQMPREITVTTLESLDVEHSGRSVIPRGTTELRGTRVAGCGDVCGRVRVLLHADEIEEFRRGEIMVARFTDPTWTSVFPLARGIVTEVGGWLSHAAILAREYGITGIVGADGALRSLRTGDLIHLRTDGTIEFIGERRTEERVSISVPLDLRRATETVPARLADLSPRGALLHVGGKQLAIGEKIDLDIPEIAGLLGAMVVRNGLPGIYGLRFERRLEAEHAVALGAPASGTVQGAA
ncbi:MAG: PEP/pyruvate-binding domain-containing protein [Planctomycetota bacterium]